MGFPRPRTTGDMSLTFKRCGNFDPFIAKTDATSTTSALEKILSRNGSVVLYVSYRKWHMVELTLDFITVQDYPVDLMSYDYDAPISESGDVDGEKFKALRTVIAKYSASTLLPVPLNNEKTGYGPIKLEKTASFFDALDSDLSTEAIESENSISMEAAGQMFRFLLYASKYTSKGNGNTLSIPKEVWFTICHENGIYQDLLNTYESSDDNSNVVNAPQEPVVVKQDPGENSSQSPPQINHNCCYECGDSLDGIFCQRCTCKSCGKGAHIGYNCPPKAPIISNPEPCNQTIDELPQTLPSFDPTCYSEKENSLPYVSKPNFVDDSPNVFNLPPQPPMYSCEFCGNDARYGHYCTPQVPFIYPEPCYNQDFNFPQDFHDFQQQYLCCENCEGPHETFQCQPINEDYYYEQNSCYDSNSFGFDQFQPLQYTVNHPIFNAQNEFLNSQNKLMEQMTSICDMVGQIMQTKEEEKRIAEEQAAKDRYWKIPICYDDDEDYAIATTPVSSTKEPDNSLSIGDEHLDTIPSVENLVPIPSEFEDLSDSNDDGTSSDDDDFEDIEYVSLEEVNDVYQEVEEIDLEDIFRIQDVILREKLLNINRLISNIESLNDNTTPDHVFKSPSSFPIPVTDSDSFFEKSDTSLSYSDKSLPEFEPFSDDTEETRSGSTITHANNSLPEYDSFLFEIEPDQGELTNIVIEEVDTFLVLEDSIPPGIESNFYPGGGEINISQNVEDDDSFTFVIRTFLPFLTYPADSPSTESEDTIFDLGIST
ncbi:putative reverse transcriptase domain-containing protein [Tanacetum coccineum]